VSKYESEIGRTLLLCPSGCVRAMLSSGIGNTLKCGPGPGSGCSPPGPVVSSLEQAVSAAAIRTATKNPNSRRRDGALDRATERDLSAGAPPGPGRCGGQGKPRRLRTPR
jgi:hypothetical protein